MLLALLAVAASAVSTDAVQVQTFPSAVTFTEQYVEAMDQQLDYADLSGPASCYDLVGITDFNLTVPVDDVELTLGDSTLDVIVRFGTIGGTDMRAYGTDEDYFDACVSFDTELRYIDLQDATITAQLRIVPPSAFDFLNNSLMLEWVEPPVVSGDLDMDLAWVPDGLVLYFFEDAVFSQVSTALSEMALPMLEDLLGDAVYAGEYEGLGMGFKLAEADFEPQQLELFVDSDIFLLTPGTCEIGHIGDAESPGGSDARLPMDRAEDADFAVALTEEFLNDTLHGSWQAGHFCTQPESFQKLVDDIALLVDPDVGKLEGWSTMNQPAVLTVDEGGMNIDMHGLQFTMTGKVDGEEVEVLNIKMNIQGDGIPGFSGTLTAMTMSMRNMRIDFTKFDTDFLVSDNALVEGLVQNAVERWAADWAEESFRDTVLFSSLYYAYDIAVLLDRAETRAGGLEMYFKLYNIDDPEVDTVPPDATAELVGTHKKTATLQIAGTDDRPDALAFAYQVDGEGYSDFFVETEVIIAELVVGEHTVEVVARDRWLNIDESPASVTFEIDGKGGGIPVACGGCSSTGTGAGWWLVAGLLAIARRRLSEET